MLARGNTDAAQRLRRAKSATSVPRRPVPPIACEDCDSAHDWALIAATRAFENASGRVEARPPLRRKKTLPHRHRSRRSLEGTLLVRRQSILGRHSLSSPSKTLRSSRDMKRPKSASQFTTTSQMLSYQSSERESEPSTVFTENPDDAVIAARFDGYGLPAPSRRRKAKSYHSPAAAPGSVTYPPSKLTYGSAESNKNTSSVQLPAVREYQTDEAIIALARDKYLQEFQPQPLQKRRSFFSNSIRSKLRKSQRFSWQTNSTISQEQLSIGQGEAESSQETQNKQAVPDSVPRKTRYFSAISSLKRHWRKAFGRSSSNSSGIPAQQVESSVPHYGQSYEFTHESGLNSTLTLSQTTSDPFIEDNPPTPPPHLEGIDRLSTMRLSVQERFEDMSRADGERSRVTSWEDSTRKSTMLLDNFEQLPDIEETKETQAEVSANPTDQTQHFKIPPRRSSSRYILKEGIDSRRLVSALIKHARKSSKRNSAETQTTIKADCPSGSVIEISPPNTIQVSKTDSNVENFNISSDVRAVPQDLLAPGLIDESPSASTNEEADIRRDVISPSVYSDRDENEHSAATYIIPSNQSSSLPGTATVLASGPVRKWPVGSSSDDQKQVTSRDWRLWAADKISKIDSVDNFTLPAFKARTDTIHEGNDTDFPSADHSFQNSGKNSVRKFSKEEEGAEKVRTNSGQHRVMNERFPKLISSIATGKDSHVSSWRIYSDDEEGAEETATQPDTNEELTSEGEIVDASNREVDVGDPPESSLHKPVETPQLKRQSRIPKLSPVPKGPVSSNPLTTTDRNVHNLDENFLLRIRKGPYNTSSSSLSKSNNDSVDSIYIPKRRSPAVTSKNNENTTPTRGQAMADDFLNRRQGKKQRQPIADENSSSPAFL